MIARTAATNTAAPLYDGDAAAYDPAATHSTLAVERVIRDRAIRKPAEYRVVGDVRSTACWLAIAEYYRATALDVLAAGRAAR
ncbi:hypothetical protein [Streptomyces sp. NPDC005096]|uniref:hypothetical protein n=1 Tax=Streptomyces sp. NPDC005096 TaxID=3154559 RepID=UPI0033AB2268